MVRVVSKGMRDKWKYHDFPTIKSHAKGKFFRHEKTSLGNIVMILSHNLCGEGANSMRGGRDSHH